jgi:DMSO/TMAO reductase YedYZ molybdopterin-dependent catalytic subunit
MGNTTLSTVCVWSVHIVSIDLKRREVVASWNGNPCRRFGDRQIKRWRASKPVTVANGMGRRRLATRAELKAMQHSPTSEKQT